MSKQDWCNIPISVPWRSTGQWRDLHIWLLDNVNNLDWDMAGVDLDNVKHRVIYFARSQDAVAFALKWQ